MSGRTSRRRPYRIGVLVLTLAVLGGVGYALTGPTGGHCGPITGLPWCTAPAVVPTADRSAVPPVTIPAAPPAPTVAASVPSPALPPAPMSVIVPAPAPVALPGPAPKSVAKAPAATGRKKRPLTKKTVAGVRAVEGSGHDPDSSGDDSDSSGGDSDSPGHDPDSSGDDSDSSGGDSSDGDATD